jgi:hypothetical protein
MSQPPDDYNGLVKDGLIASILGGLAMTARLLMSEEPVTIGWVLRRLTAASITAVLVGYGVKDYIASESLRLCVIGGCGYCAPEITDYLIKYVKARGQKEINNVKVKPRGKKTKK